MIGVYLDGVEGCKCRPPVLEIWRHHWPRHHHRHHHHHQKQHFHLHNNDYQHHQEYWSQFADPGCSGWPGFHWNSSLHLLQTHHCTAHSIGKYPRNLNFDERRSEPFFWQYLKKGRNHAAAIVNFNEYSLFCFKWEIGKINDKWLMKASSSAKTWRWKSESLHGDDLEFFRLTRKKSAGLPAAGLTLQDFVLHSLISGRWTNRAELFWLWRLCYTICFVCIVSELWSPSVLHSARPSRFATDDLQLLKEKLCRQHVSFAHFLFNKEGTKSVKEK